MSQNNRKYFFINKVFQTKFIIYTLIPTLLSQAIIWLSIEYYLNKLIEKGQSANLDPNHFYYKLIAEQMELMKNIFIIVGLISFVIVILWATFISHKIAGPLFRMTKMLNNHDPNLKHLKFRPGDFFPEVADAVRSYLSREKRN